MNGYDTRGEGRGGEGRGGEERRGEERRWEGGKHIIQRVIKESDNHFATYEVI